MKVLTLLLFIYYVIPHFLLFNVCATISPLKLVQPRPMKSTLTWLASIKEDPWDFLIFAMEWPQSFCIENDDMSSQHHCIVPQNVNQWTIHGLWPASFNTSQRPENCNQSYPFNFTEIKDLKSNLSEHWPNLENLNSTSFWAHEWNKHGTCALQFPPLTGEHKYFNKTLELVEQISMERVLKEKGIIPDGKKNYTLTDFTEAVNAKLGKKPIVYCYTIVHGPKLTYVSQIQLCLDKSFQPIDCVKQLGNCGERDILYPPIVH